jgi:hypothetical protein
MTKPAGRTPPPDAAARRRAPPILTYSVEQLPSFDAAFYNRARAEVSKVAESHSAAARSHGIRGVGGALLPD